MKAILLEVGGLIQSAEKVYANPAHILIEGDTIARVGLGTYEGDRTQFEVIARPHSLAMPGLINTHGHAAMTLLRGAGDDMPLMTWLNDRIFPLEAKLTQDAIYWGTMLASWEMIRSGTTCFTDMYFFMNDAARAVMESGLRGVLSWGMVGFDEATRVNSLANSRQFVTQWNKQANGRITTTLGPHAPYTCPPEFLTEVADLAHELDVAVQIHLAETKTEVEDSLRTYGKSPIQYARDAGIFARPTLAAHCVHVTDEDIDIMKKHAVRVAHNPQSNLKLGSGVAPLTKMLAAGLTVGLGTDGAASNNNLDMFEELRLAALLHKGISYDATVVPATTAFSLATVEGARAVFQDGRLGSLQPGMQADITLLDMQSPHFQPGHHLLSDVVYAAGADDVTDVFVAGRQLLSNRTTMTLDEEQIRYEVNRIAQMLR